MWSIEWSRIASCVTLFQAGLCMFPVEYYFSSAIFYENGVDHFQQKRTSSQTIHKFQFTNFNHFFIGGHPAINHTAFLVGPAKVGEQLGLDADGTA